MLTAVTWPADHVPRNRAAWDRWAAEYAAAGARHWAAAEPSWGIWSIPEAQAGVLPSDLNGLDSIELGCGTGYVSAWLGRRGARPAGLDNSAAQLATARALQDQHGLRFPLVHASAEQAPFARELRPGGLRVRGQHLVRPLRLDPRGGPAAAAVLRHAPVCLARR
jgi:SAM-dependent methyltransferase